MRIVLKRGTDQIVTLEGLRAHDSQQYLNGATVTGSLFDSRGTPVPALQGISMPYVSGTDGNYEWFIAAHLSMLQKNVEYSLVITAKQGDLHYRTVRVCTVMDDDGE